MSHTASKSSTHYRLAPRLAQCSPGLDGLTLPSLKTAARLAPYSQVNRNHGILAACLAGSTLSVFTGPRHKM